MANALPVSSHGSPQREMGHQLLAHWVLAGNTEAERLHRPSQPPLLLTVRRDERRQGGCIGVHVPQQAMNTGSAPLPTLIASSEDPAPPSSEMI